MNISNTFLGLFTDVDLPSEAYLNALREKIPKTFKDFFGRYNPNDHSDLTNDDLLLFNSLNGGNGASDLDSLMLNNYYFEQSRGGGSGSIYYEPAMSLSTSTIVMSTDTSHERTSFRNILKNKTQTQLNILSNYFYQRDEDFYNFINVMENLPLYITLSYLLVRYSMLFLSSFVDYIRDKWRFKANYDIGKEQNKKKINDPQRLMSAAEIKEHIALCDLMIKDLDDGYKVIYYLFESMFRSINEFKHV